MNMKKLKLKLIENEKTYADVSKKLGISVTAVSNKMTGKSKFDCAEATILSEWLSLEPKESIEIFLT